MGLFSSLIHSGIQRGYFPLFIFLICLFLVLLLFSFSFFKLGSFPQDQFGANIWSETVHGEGRLGDFGGGGEVFRQRQKQKIPVRVYLGCLAERRGRSAPRELGTGAAALGSKNQPSRELGEREALLCTVAVPLCSTALLQEDGDVPRDPKALERGLFLLERVIGAAACSPSAAGCLSGASLARSVPLLPAPSGGFPPSPGSVVNPSQVGGCSKQTLPFLIPISPHSDPQIPLLLQGQILHHRCWGVLLGSSSLPGGGGRTSWAER